MLAVKGSCVTETVCANRSLSASSIELGGVDSFK